MTNVSYVPVQREFRSRDGLDSFVIQDVEAREYVQAPGEGAFLFYSRESAQEYADLLLQCRLSVRVA